MKMGILYNNNRLSKTDSNAAAHSVDSDICYIVINLSARFKSYNITFIS